MIFFNVLFICINSSLSKLQIQLYISPPPKKKMENNWGYALHSLLIDLFIDPRENPHGAILFFDINE